ncbi:hypothetical protein M4D55_20090 [Metabacillus idriensis]|uniref:hypothetical protein n=1 Tax=Metabacillus idriensis TaxID=324768 RepID=UPI001479232B|nr:hypothetical protein [Metabacillus idriensis]MCM3598068.1 hypothetical protein [Metabacillus idriensis]
MIISGNYPNQNEIIEKFREYCDEKYKIEFGYIASDEIANFFWKEFNKVHTFKYELKTLNKKYERDT